MDPDIDGRVVVSGLPTGSVLNNSKFTFNGISISGPLVDSTVQMRVMSDPKGGMGLAMLLDTVIEMGAGTACIIHCGFKRLKYHFQFP